MIGLGLLALATSGTVWLWHDGRAIRWAEQWVIRRYLREIEPKLPFQLKIRSVDVDAHWAEFRNGKISQLEILLEREPFRLLLKGPLNIRPVQRDAHTQYALYFEANHSRLDWKKPGLLSPWQSGSPLSILLSVQASEKLSSISRLSVQLSAEKIDLPPFTLKAVAPRLSAEWDENSDRSLRASLSSRRIEYQESDARMANLSGLSIKGTFPMSLLPFSPIGPLELDVKASGIEALYDPYFLDLDFRSSPVHIDMAFEDQKPKRMNLRVGKRNAPRIETQTQISQTTTGALQALIFKGEGLHLPLPGLFKVAQSFPELAPLIDLELTQGALNFAVEGSFPFEPPLNSKKMLSDWVEKISGQVAIKNLSGKMRSQAFAFQGLDLHLPFRLRDGTKNATLSVKRIAWKRAAGEIRKTPLALSRKRDAAREVIQLTLSDGIRIENTETPLTIGPSTLKVRPGEEDLFEAHTSLHVPQTAIQPWLDALCIHSARPFPAQIDIELPRISIFPDAIEPKGSARITAFGGALEVSDLGLYEWMTPFPETDFSVTWDGFQLGELGPWLNFGKMEGVLRGYARHVTLVGPVPTHYNFRVEMKPTSGDRVVFSPQAMRNFVEMIAGDQALKSMPFGSSWLFFGWPRQLVGGYDVKYAGLTAFSTDGSILVETLDPPGSTEHYLLKSSSKIFDTDTFSVRLASRAYPAVLDAEGMRTWLDNVMSTIEGLSKKNEAPPPPPTVCLPREFDVGAEAGSK